MLETMTSIILIYVTFRSVMDDTVPKNVYGFVIAGYYAAISICFDRVTGGSMNPARSLGPSIFDGKLRDLWLYICGPLLGCAIGAFAYKAFLMRDNIKVTEVEQHTDLKLLKPVDLEVAL